MADHQALTRLLDVIDTAAEGETVSVQGILDHIGDQSIMPVVLIIALLLVSPLSGIPGFSTLSALVIVIVMMQALFGRHHLWLPPFLRNRQVRSQRLRKAVRWLRKPAAWIDRHSHPRLRILTSGPLRWLTLALCLAVPMIWPVLELLPFVTSIGAGAVSLMSFGLMTRDGFYVLGGYAVVAAMAAAIVALVQAGT